MRVAILSSDARLARMLELEIKLGGHTPCAPNRADVLLLDLDHPAKHTKTQNTALRIGLSSAQARTDASLFACLSLPFSARELQQTLRTLTPFSPPRTVVKTDTALLLDGTPLSLSTTERRLLECLLAHKDAVAPEDALRACLGEGADIANKLAVYIYRLRRKVGAVHIRRVRGKGYQWIEESR